MAIVDRLGLVGQTIDGRYLVTGLIGEGGMGTVYRARHVRIDRIVAIKCLHLEYARDQRALQGLFDEARAAATLQHPNIVAATDMGELPDGSPYLVLELLEGRALHDEIDYIGRLSVRRALRIARQIANAVRAAHEAGIIHRDLKSDNVFLIDQDSNPDHVKIFDFGVAHVLGRVGIDTNHIVGTPEFMPPEQITDPQTIDARADVYAVGAILYHMLSGKLPYSELGLPVTELLTMVLTEPPSRLSGVPEDVRVLVEDAMARDRDQRIQSMPALVERIDQIVPAAQSSPSLVAPPGAARRPTPAKQPAIPMAPSGKQPVVAMAPSEKQPAFPMARRSRLPLALLIGGVVAGVVGVVVIAGAMHGSSDKADEPKAAVIASTPPVPAPAPAPDAEPTAPTHARAVGRPSGVDQTVEPPPPPPQHPVHIAAHTAPHPVATPAHHNDKTTTPPVNVTTKPDVPDPKAGSGRDPKAGSGKDETRPGPDVTKPPPDTTKPATVLPPSNAGPKPGTIDVAATRAAIRPHLGAIQRCFDRAKMDDMSLAGGVTIRISIGGDGAVTNAAVAKSTLGSPSAEHCITQEISSWHLPKPSGDVASSLLYPFVFE